MGTRTGGLSKQTRTEYLGTSMVRPQPYPNPISRTKYFMYENRVLTWILVRHTKCLGIQPVQLLDNLSSLIVWDESICKV